MQVKQRKGGKARRSEQVSFLVLGATSLAFWCFFSLTTLPG